MTRAPAQRRWAPLSMRPQPVTWYGRAERGTRATRAGRRQFVDLGALDLERGGRLPEVRVAYETWGRLNPARDNVILVEHALTGDSHVSGEAGPGHPSPGWWNGLIGTGPPGRPRAVVRRRLQRPGRLPGHDRTVQTAPDGQAWGGRFPYITVRDQVAVEAALLDAARAPRIAAVVGGSMGGMRALEWAVTHPERVDAASCWPSRHTPPPSRSPGARPRCSPSGGPRLRGR